MMSIFFSEHLRRLFLAFCRFFIQSNIHCGLSVDWNDHAEMVIALDDLP